PDPWPKKRHHKRRIIQEETSRALGNSLKPGGVLLTATDILEIHQDHLEKLNGNPLLRLTNGADTLAVPAKWYGVVSTYERKGRNAERTICYTRHVRAS
ncbi:MAG: tRNA (guanosine(46)-N7)-methyltransferase TrmB, partial [Spirochaetia bacterium]|nr:tRNA (guanosine(46)-N7)-methyltransferase TrmB [Spirochaetia bacterium]